MIDTHVPHLQFEQVSLKSSVGTHDLLQDVSFAIHHGDRLAVVGSSGSGKTSLLRLINRLSDPTQGSIYLDGQNICTMPVLSLRAKVPLVMQESKLLDMPVQQALTYPLKLRKLDQPTIQARLKTWIHRLNIPAAWMDRTETQLSVGQRQVVAIARALMIEPPLILLDEPTASLDAGRCETLIHLLHDISHTNQTTVVMANHDLALAQRFCTHVLVLDQGRVWLKQPQAKADWHAIKEQIIHAKQQSFQEWGDDD